MKTKKNILKKRPPSYTIIKIERQVAYFLYLDLGFKYSN